MLDALGRTRPRALAGERVRYSNYGAGVLCIALTLGRHGLRIPGRDGITSPLRLNDTGDALSDEQRGRLAAGTKWRGGPAGL